jgi:predicted nucleic acid-binding protein
METKSNIILADSSGLISLLIDTDHNHAKAKAIAQSLSEEQVSVFIPSEIFAETINILGKKYGHTQATRFVDSLLQSVIFLVKPSSDIARRDALDLFKTATSSVSYTDCLVMAMAEQHGTVEIFGFDEIFGKRGYFLPTARKRAA